MTATRTRTARSATPPDRRTTYMAARAALELKVLLGQGRRAHLRLTAAGSLPSEMTSSYGTALRREISRRSSTRARWTRTRSRTRSVGSLSDSREVEVTNPVMGVRSSWAKSAVKRLAGAG